MPCERDFIDGLTQIETAKTHGVATESGCKDRQALETPSEDDPHMGVGRTHRCHQ